MTTPFACPDCGSPIELITKADGGMVSEPTLAGYLIIGRPLPRRERPADFGACTGCEFIIEVGA